MVPALGLGLWLWCGVGRGPGTGWLHAKLVLVIACSATTMPALAAARLRALTHPRSDRWYRVFNEVSVMLFAGVVVVVVVKPF